MNSQNVSQGEGKPILRTDGFIQLSYVLNIRSLLRKVNQSGPWKLFFRNKGMRTDEELHKAVLMVLRKCFEDDGPHVRFDIGYEEKHIPQWWNNLHIRERQGHTDNDEKEKALITFLISIFSSQF